MLADNPSASRFRAFHRWICLTRYRQCGLQKDLFAHIWQNQSGLERNRLACFRAHFRYFYRHRLKPHPQATLRQITMRTITAFLASVRRSASGNHKFRKFSLNCLHNQSPRSCTQNIRRRIGNFISIKSLPWWCVPNEVDQCCATSNQPSTLPSSNDQTSCSVIAPPITTLPKAINIPKVHQQMHPINMHQTIPKR